LNNSSQQTRKRFFGEQYSAGSAEAPPNIVGVTEPARTSGAASGQVPASTAQLAGLASPASLPGRGRISGMSDELTRH